MRRLLLAAALGGLLLVAPHGALAFDYAEPSVPAALGGPDGSVVVTDPAEAPTASLQTVPNEPPFVPHGTWDDAEGGGCAVWDWNVC